MLNIALRRLLTAELNLGTGILPSNGQGGQHCLHKHRDLIQAWTRAYIGFLRSQRGDTTKEIKNFYPVKSFDSPPRCFGIQELPGFPFTVLVFVGEALLCSNMLSHTFLVTGHNMLMYPDC